jgi:hypothetical protein
MLITERERETSQASKLSWSRKEGRETRMTDTSQTSKPVLPNYLVGRPLLVPKITTDPYIPAGVHLECPDGKLTKLNINISFSSRQA